MNLPYKFQYYLNPSVDEVKLFKILSNYDCVIAGGYCLTKAQNNHGILASGYNDIDIFCSHKDHDNLIEDLNSRDNITLDYESKHALTYRMTNHYQVNFQVIKPSIGVEKKIESFDMNNSKYWSVKPWDKIYTNQPKSTLSTISPNPTKWSYEFMGRMNKYIHSKKLSLPKDKKFNKHILDVIRDNTDERYADSTGYTKLRKPQNEENLAFMINHLSSKHHPAYKMVLNDINNGYDYRHLESIVTPFSQNQPNFLFDFWAQKNYFDALARKETLMRSIPDKLIDKDLYRENTKKVQEIYPELLL